MTDNPQSYWIRPCTRVWFLLVLLTALALVIGKLQLNSHTVMGVLLATTLWKGLLIGDYFMALRRTRRLWRFLVWGWLLIVAGGVSLAYSLG